MKVLRAAIALAATSLLCGALASAAPSDLRYAKPEQLVRTSDGARLNLTCMGHGSPAVILDAGWEDWAPAWALTQPEIAAHTRVCAVDRAGSGFSSAGPFPRTSVRIAEELHSALHRAGIAPPYILAGHSFGGYNIRTFADLYMPEVAGAVFVDVESGDMEPAKMRAADDRDDATYSAQLAACGRAVAQHRPLPPLPHTHIPCSHQFFRGLPMKEWSPKLNATVLRIANTDPGLYRAVVSEMREMPADERWLTAHRRSFGSRPLIVLTAQNHNYDTAKTPPAVHAKHEAFERQWAAIQRKYLSLSSDSRQVLVPKSGHYIELDQPNVVIDAVLSELSQVRNRHTP